MKLLPDRIGEFKAILVVEGHVHVGGFESALPAGHGRRLGASGQVHQIELLIHRKRDGTKTTYTFEMQIPRKARLQPEPVALEPVNTAVQSEAALDLELRFRESEGGPLRGDGNPGALRRHGGQIDAQGGGIVG